MKLNNKLKNSLLHTLLSWFNNIAHTDIEVSYNEADNIQKLIMDIEKYYTKQRPIQVTKATSDMLSVKLKKIQNIFETQLTILDDKNKPVISDNGDIETITYSPQLLSISVLDYMLNVERDTSIRNKFGYVNTNEMLLYMEDEHKELYYSTLKILNILYKEIGI